jgi:hypothetical protein
MIKNKSNQVGQRMPVIPALAAKAGGSQVEGQPGLHSKNLSQKINK